jgi:RNA polymerase sigma-70 factor, ECF subfamily
VAACPLRYTVGEPGQQQPAAGGEAQQMSPDARSEEQERERELIARGQQGDRAAFNALVEKYQGAAYALALRMLGDPDTAADVTQEAFFSAFRALGNFHGSSFRAWLLRIVSNGCYDVFRARGRQPVTSLEALLERDDATSSSDSRLPTAMVDPSWSPEESMLRGEMISSIEAALLLLPPEQRLAVVLCDIQGMPYEEVARIMETPLGTVKSRIARARAQLRTLLTRGGELSPPAQRHDAERSP